MTDITSTAAFRGFQLTTHLKADYSVEALEQALRRKTIKGWAWILHDHDETTPHLHCVFWCERDPGLDALSRWFDLPQTQFDRIKRGKIGFACALKYCLHEDENSQAQGKFLYNDTDLHVSEGWDWRAFVDEMSLRESLSGSAHRKARTVAQQVAEGELSVREALRRGSRSETQLRRLRAMYLAHRDPPGRRIAFYVYGADYYAVQALSRGLAEALAGGRGNVFELTDTFDLYDGEPVIHAYIKSMWDLRDALSAFDHPQRARAFVSIFPSRTIIPTRFGPSQLVHEHVVLAGRHSFDEFQGDLDRMLSGLSLYGERFDSGHESYVPIVIPVSADELAVQVNQGVLGEGAFEAYRSLGTFRMNLKAVIEQSKGFPDDERLAIESAAVRRNLAPALEARARVVEATTVASTDGESTRARVEELLQQAGQPIAI